jgi:hypothetical protein
MGNTRQLSAKADQIWVHNAQLHHDTVAAIAPDPEVLEASVAAVHGSRQSTRWQRRSEWQQPWSWVRQSSMCGGVCTLSKILKKIEIYIIK